MFSVARSLAKAETVAQHIGSSGRHISSFQCRGVIASERLQYFDFDQSHLAVDVMILRVCAEPRLVMVTFMAYTSDQSRLGARPHRCRRVRCNMDVGQLALPTHAVIIALCR
jgi:hypothetical protein